MPQELKTIDEVGKKAKTLGASHISSTYGEPLNELEIQNIEGQNKRLEEQAWARYEAAIAQRKQLEELNNQLKESNQSNRAIDPTATVPGIRTGGVSNIGAYGELTLPSPAFKPPKLEKIPDPKYPSVSLSFPKDGSGSKDKKGFVSLNLLSGKNPSPATGGFNLSQWVSDTNAQKIDSATGLVSNLRTNLSAGANERNAIQKKYTIKDSDGSSIYSSDATISEAPLLKVKQMVDFYYQRLKSDGSLDLNNLSTKQKRQLDWVREYAVPDNPRKAVLGLGYYVDNKTGEEQLMLVPGAAAADRPFNTNNSKFDTSSFLNVKVLPSKSQNNATAMFGAAQSSTDNLEMRYQINSAGEKAIKGLTEVWDMIAEDNDNLQDIVRTIGNNQESIEVHPTNNPQAWNIFLSGAALYTFSDLVPHIDTGQENRIKYAYKNAPDLIKGDTWYAAMSPAWYSFAGNPMSSQVPNYVANRNAPIEPGLFDFPAYTYGGFNNVYNPAINGTSYKKYPAGTFRKKP